MPFRRFVDDKDAVRRALVAAGVKPLPGRFLDFRDPWGNRVEIVGYDNIQFSKAPNVLRGMGLAHLSKNDKAIKELATKGMGPNETPATQVSPTRGKQPDNIAHVGVAGVLRIARAPFRPMRDRGWRRLSRLSRQRLSPQGRADVLRTGPWAFATSRYRRARRSRTHSPRGSIRRECSPTL